MIYLDYSIKFFIFLLPFSLITGPLIPEIILLFLIGYLTYVSSKQNINYIFRNNFFKFFIFICLFILIRNYFSDYLIIRVPIVFKKNKNRKNSFFDVLNNNFKKNKIYFDINQNSLRDFITLDDLFNFYVKMEKKIYEVFIILDQVKVYL